MRYLFIDNYRGFDSTFIPIEDVNFLVGENSSGKSSILALINLLGSPDFWLNLEFNNDEIELGGFNDIISVNSNNKKSFRVGVVECDKEAEFPTSRQHTFLMTFVAEKGRPILKDYSFIKYDEQIRIVMATKTLRFKISKLTPKQDLGSTLWDTFKGWLDRPAGSDQGYKQVRLKDLPFGHRRRIFFLGGILQQILPTSKDKDEKSNLSRIFNFDFPTFSQPLAWIAPVRSKPSRIYSGLKTVFTPEGEHTPLLIKDILSRDKSEKEFQSFISEFGEESGLFENIYVRNFGKVFASPFELGVKINGNRLRISDVGYGVSQVLPIIVELFDRGKGHWFVLQQPEVHLHPKAQAALGNLFMNLAINQGVRFFIETHSDYIIDRFRTCYRNIENSSEKISSQVLFFERCDGHNRVHIIPILDDGSYSDQQPTSFREFFINEELRILGI